jgi:hypothetical protein
VGAAIAAAAPKAACLMNVRREGPAVDRMAIESFPREKSKRVAVPAV